MEENSKAINTDALKVTVETTALRFEQVAQVLKLSVLEQNTIPFIARYRKEVTGNLDEVAIAKILETYEATIEMEKRREFIFDTIKKMEMMTPDLEKNIKLAKTINELEELYAPFKSKKKTKGQLATEAGLLPLAEEILKGKITLSALKELATKFLSPEKKIASPEDAIEGARAIILEQMAHNAIVKDKMRQYYWGEALLKVSKKKDAEKQEEWQKFRDYFEFSQKISELKSEKNGHRFMAIRRGVTLGILTATVDFPEDRATAVLTKNFLPDHVTSDMKDFITALSVKAFNLYISTALDMEVKTDLKQNADEHAINIFGINLKNLLLQPYLGAKAVLGIDPGIRTGCKLALVDDTGKFLVDFVIYPDRSPEESAKIVDALCAKFNVKHIAVGNGTAGRETLEFLEEFVPAVKNENVHATLVNEAGASVYSASEIAREEFPDKDVTIRGAISIARRFQDPLAELVKIDPKSIGVGQYQHDVNQAKLKKNLQQVVESCVNFVGVDLNTASAPLLSFISGIGPAMAQSLVRHRQASGPFKSRQQLLSLPRFTAKVFEQSAGFLRIYNGEHPLDGTFIHPEKYSILEDWCKENKTSTKELISTPELIHKFTSDSKLIQKLGEFTHQDIVKSLKAPGQDPRNTFKTTEFRKDAKKIEDLKVGEWYTGIVNNITQFGAFVDIGVKESGLLHISQMSDKFIENPLAELKVGQEVKVKVLEVDLERKRISLSRKSDSVASKPAGASKTSGNEKNKSPNPKLDAPLKNNAFSSLKNFKIPGSGR